MAINREAITASAEKLVARGKIDGAIKEYRKLVADNPGDAMTLNRLGDLYVRINRNEEAVSLFTQIAERYTDDGFFVKAIAIFKKIHKLDPTRMMVYERLAELYHKQGLVSEARTQYQVLVDYYLKHGRADAGESVLRKMSALDSGDPSPHVKLAELYHDRGEHEKELHEHRQLAELMLRHKRIDEATQVYARAISAAPQDLGFITDAVLGLKDAGHLGAAAKLLTIAIEKNPQAEKIARIAGLSKEQRLDASGARARPGGEPRVYKVSDVTSPPPELRVVPAARRPPTPEPPLPRLPLDAPAAPEPALGEAASAGDEGIGFELEIEGIDAGTPSAELDAELDWSFEPEPTLALDLDLDLAHLEPPEQLSPIPEFETEPQFLPPPAPGAPRRAQRPTVDLDLAELESASFEVSRKAQSQGRRLGDLLAEAEVFRKYGLGEKAADRVREILKEDPHHPGALGLGVQLALDQGRPDRAMARAQELERLAAERTAAGEVWAGLWPKLEKAGFGFSGGRLDSAPAPAQPQRDSIASLLDQLAVETPVEPVRRPPPRTAEPDLSALVDGLRESLRPKPEPKPPPAEPARLPPELTLAPPAAAPPPAVPPPELELAQPAEGAIEDRLAWLDEAAVSAGKPAPAQRSEADEALFEEEEGFFDLAAELEEELTKEEIVSGREVLPREEPSLEEIVEGFKKGVAESLSPEDYDTHFNLGIAYREMGLLDEAIGEFQLAAKNESYLLDCCSLLGGCFLEKGLPELAIKWFQKGLAVPNLSEEGSCGLLYDLGNLYLATDDVAAARRTFVELYGVNSNYRDVVAKLEELGAH